MPRATSRRAGRPCRKRLAPLDGGPPPDGLLLALGARTGAAAADGGGTGLGSDAGGPPVWLVGVLSGGADQRGA